MNWLHQHGQALAGWAVMLGVVALFAIIIALFNPRPSQVDPNDSYDKK